MESFFSQFSAKEASDSSLSIDFEVIPGMATLRRVPLPELIFPPPSEHAESSNERSGSEFGKLQP